MPLSISSFFFFNDTATTEIYTLSLHDALPIFRSGVAVRSATRRSSGESLVSRSSASVRPTTQPGRSASSARRPFWNASLKRSEEHTSELQSLAYLVCRLLLEKKKTNL